MYYQKTTAPVLQSLTKPILLMGGERENVILLACISLSLSTAGQDILSLSLSLLIWSIGLMASKLSAKTDPWATKIFLKSLFYREFYSARERMNTPHCVIKRRRRI